MIFLQKEEKRLADIPTLYIRPNRSQPRKFFEQRELLSLAQSISANGILQPLCVRKIDTDNYELVSGERRLRAAIIAGIQKVPCIIMTQCSDKQSAIYALLENLQRTDLNMFEEARAIKKLIIECNMTQECVAKQLGKKQSTIANKIRLLRLTESQQQIILENNLSERHARVILKINGNDRTTVLQKVVNSNLNVAQTEELIEDVIYNTNNEEKHHITSKLIVKDVRIIINTLTKAFDTMKLSGINAVSTKNENDNYIEYTVKIPKNSIYRQMENKKKNKGTDESKTLSA